MLASESSGCRQFLSSSAPAQLTDRQTIHSNKTNQQNYANFGMYALSWSTFKFDFCTALPIVQGSPEIKWVKIQVVLGFKWFKGINGSWVEIVQTFKLF